MHGAGFATREARGERLSVYSNLRDGLRAKPETIEALSRERPTLRSAVEDYRRNPERATNLRQLLALQRALADHFTSTVDLDDPHMILRAFDMQSRAMKTALRVATLEFEKGPVNPAEVDRFINAVAATLRAFVPSDQLHAAFQFLHMEIARDLNQ
jgi:hypothetical protein